MGSTSAGAPDQVSFLRGLKEASIRLQRAKDRGERSLAIDSLFDLIRQAKIEASHMRGRERQRFISRVEMISGMRINQENANEEDDQEAPEEPKPLTAIEQLPKNFEFDLSGRLPRYVRQTRAGDPDMRVNQLAIKKQGSVTMILALGESGNVFYVTEGTLGGEFRTWDLPNVDEARRQFSLLRDAGYQEVSPGALKFHRSSHTVPTAGSPNRRRLGPNPTAFRRRKSDPPR